MSNIDKLKPGKYAILFRNNWDGEGDTYETFAILDAEGIWRDEDGDELLEYQGDEVLSAWPMDDDSNVLASIEAEPVAFRSKLQPPSAIGSEHWDYTDHRQPDAFELESCVIERLYTAPPAPVENTGLQRKAAIHDALCEKYNVESLTDFVDWQRNHIAELEAAPPAPVGPGETAVMPDYPGYVMTQRECYQAGKKAGLSEAGNSPVIPECSCRACRPVTFADSRFVVCPDCGNKRCPHANDHRNACTGSNEPGQEGSAYPAAPQQEVKP